MYCIIIQLVLGTIQSIVEKTNQNHSKREEKWILSQSEIIQTIIENYQRKQIDKKTSHMQMIIFLVEKIYTLIKL